MLQTAKKALYLTVFCIIYSGALLAARPVTYYALISTGYGSSIIRLYNQTPKHRDNFVKLVREGKYNGLLFHRVIKGFMIQGGDPDSRNADTAKALGDGDVGYTVPAEINDSLYHKKYVLAAARDERPDKASSGIQFYLVQGKIFSEQQLADVEQKRLKRRLPDSHRNVYKSIGGAPHLDGNYTVYGEIVYGGEMVDRIAALPTNSKDRPLVNVPMEIKMLSHNEVRRIERQLAALHKLADIKL